MITVRISIFCQDQVGLVSAITGRLFDLGVNLGDTSFSILGSGAEFAIVCDVPKSLEKQEIEEQLSDLKELQGADINVSLFELDSTHGSNANITHFILINGGDNPGLIARISEVFIEFGANIVRLNSERISGEKGDQYGIEIAVWIPAINSEACLATVSNTAATLQMQCQINAA